MDNCGNAQTIKDLRLLANIIAFGVVAKQTNNYENGLFVQQKYSDINSDNTQ